MPFLMSKKIEPFYAFLGKIGAKPTLLVKISKLRPFLKQLWLNLAWSFFCWTWQPWRKLKQSDVTWLKFNFKWNNVDIDYGEINKILRFDFRRDLIFDIAPAALKNIAHLKSGSQSNLKVIILLCMYTNSSSNYWYIYKLYFRIKQAGDCLIANKFRLDVSSSAVLMQRLNLLNLTQTNGVGN